MKIVTQRLWMIVGATALLGLTFGLGYMVGSRSHKTPDEAANTLSDTDMQRAFGSVKSPILEPMTQEPAAMSLGGLVAGLEKKVAANPENIDQQLLLAQTYNELDNRAKSLNLLNTLLKRFPGNVQVKITRASILMTGTSKEELTEAYQLFAEVIKLKPDAASMARLYQGEIRVKLDHIAKQ
jgi:cytochrome c-type biogenesis protein CcmH/NrfG